MSQHFQTRRELLARIEELEEQLSDSENTQPSQQPTSTVDPELDKHYQVLFEQAGDSIFIVDSKTLQILVANENAARRLNYSIEELQGLSFRDIEVGKTTRLEESTTFAWTSSISGLFIYESVHRRKDGTTIPVEVSSSIIQIDNRKVIQNVVRDTTKRKQLEEHKLETILERERADLLTNFIEQTSHHFRTPLSIIGTNAFLLSKTEDSDKRDMQAGQISTQITHISRLVDGLIMLSTLAKKRSLPLESIELVYLVNISIAQLRDKVIERQIRVSLDMVESSLQIDAHEEYLNIALRHLYDNAINSIGENGDILIHVYKATSTVCIEVHDSGTGIDSEDMAHIFDTFYRADKSGTTRGLGLGLAIVKLIVEMHDGTIEVESNHGHGSMFRIVLPLTD